MWSQASRQKHQKRHSTSHNLLSHQPFPVLTLSPFPNTHDPNTHKFMCSCTMSFKRNKSAKMPIPRQNIKKGEQRGGELPPNDKNIAHTNLPHIPITPSLTPSSWYHQLSYPQPGSHTPCCQKHNTSHPQQERVTRNEKSRRKFFSLPKRVKPKICLDLLVRRWKRDTTSWFKN